VSPLDALASLLKELAEPAATQAFRALLTGDAFSVAVKAAPPETVEELFASFEANMPQLILNVEDHFGYDDGDAFARAVGMQLAAASARSALERVKAARRLAARVWLASNRPGDVTHLQDRAEALLAEISEYDPDGLWKLVRRLAEEDPSLAVGPLRDLCGDPREWLRRAEQLPVLFVMWSEGVVGRLHLELLDRGRGECYPEPAVMALHPMTAEFAETARRAWDLAKSRAGARTPWHEDSRLAVDVRWRIEGVRDGIGQPLLLHGPSLGAALFVHFYRLLCDLEPLAYWAISARLAEQAGSGFIEDVGGISAKVRAAFADRMEPPIHRVLVHAHNLVEARQAAVAVGADANRVQRASSLDDVLDRVKQQHNARMEEMVPVRTHLPNKVKDFLAAYLGSDEKRVPFGGRGDVLGRLHAWREAPGEDSFRLVVAPMGRGKSAVLARWYDSLLRKGVRGDDVAFVPISIRFSTQGTNDVLRLLADRLDVAVGIEINLRYEPRERIATAMNRLPELNRQVLVILDGLDEAQDHKMFENLFTSGKRSNLRIMAAVRSSRLECGTWLALLGWPDGPERVIELERISAEGIGEVLRSMGRPLDRLGGRQEWLDRLAELTEGDPLVLELFVLQLWEAGPDAWTPESLRDMKPGLGAYFVRWWDQQKALRSRLAPLGLQKAAMDTLRVLATAHGPLGFAELRTLLRQKDIDTDELTEILLHLDRFVRAVPRGAGGLWDYTLHHPRFRDFFLCQEGEHADSPRMIQVDAREKAELRGRFVAWGQGELDRLEAGTLAPEVVPPYLVRYLGRHLEEAEAGIEQRMRLVSRQWHRACEALDGGGQSSFLRDLETTWRAVSRRNDADVAGAATQLRYLAEEVHTWMIRSGIRAASLADQPRLVIELVRDERMPIAEVMRWLGEMEDWAAAVVIEGLAPVIGQRDRSWLVELERRARALEGLGDRAISLAALAEYREGEARSEVLIEALDLARQERNHDSRARALVAVAALLEGEDRLDALADALEAAPQAMDHHITHARALVAVAALLEGDGRRDVLANVLDAARKEPYDWACSCMLSAVAALLEGDGRRDALAEALDAARKEKSHRHRAHALAEIAALLEGDERRNALAEALDAASKNQDHYYRARTLAAMATMLEGAERRDALGEALDAARREEGHMSRARALACVVDLLEGAERRNALDEALDAAHKVESDTSRARALSEVAALLGGDRRPDALAEALDAARKIWDHGHRARELADVAVSLEGAGHRNALAEALDAAHKVESDAERADALAAVAALLEGEKRRNSLADALDAARKEEDDNARVQALSVVAALLEGEERRNALAEALDTAREARHGIRGGILTAMAALLEGEKRRNVLAEALDKARALRGDPQSRADKLLAVAALLEGEERRNALAEALDAARKVNDHWMRARALVAVAVLLEGEKRREAIADALDAALEKQSQDTRGIALAEVAVASRGLANEPLVRSWPIVSGILRSNVSLAGAWRILAALLPCLFPFGGPDFPSRLARVLHDIQARWPD
jgi:hypothetical protein